MLETAALDYALPARLIATKPAEPRDSARLLVIRRADPAWIEHLRVSDLPGLLRRGDLLVRNETCVLPARFRGVRQETGGAVEGLYLETVSPPPERRWRVLLRSNGRLRAGQVIELRRASEEGSALAMIPLERDEDAWIVGVESEGMSEAGIDDAALLLEMVGAPPLPPYILGARRERTGATDDPRDRGWYQTVFADASESHSVAAPTAGLHFTDALIGELEGRGVRMARVLLHVGAGTFKPVQTEFVEQHPMHAERFHVSESTIQMIEETRAGDGRVIAIGTTTARALESVQDSDSMRVATGATRLLITPGHSWRRVDGLMTNFHLPRSTLLAMVGALLPEGLPRLLDVYRVAIEAEYRFYSYGDAMLILP